MVQCGAVRCRMLQLPSNREALRHCILCIRVYVRLCVCLCVCACVCAREMYFSTIVMSHLFQSDSRSDLADLI